MTLHIMGGEMIETALGLTSGFSAPHRVATKVGADVLDAGGTAVEVMVAARRLLCEIQWCRVMTVGESSPDYPAIWITNILAKIVVY